MCLDFWDGHLPLPRLLLRIGSPQGHEAALEEGEKNGVTLNGPLEVDHFVRVLESLPVGLHG